VSVLILYAGIGIVVIGGIGLLIAAFKTSLPWGLAVLVVGPAAIAYLILHWQDGKGPFKLQVFGLIIIAVFVYSDREMLAGNSDPYDLSAYPSQGPRISSPAASRQSYSCDGRTHCSQMTSCAEATYFLRHCPDTKMDGNNDGIPCERQWCR